MNLIPLPTVWEPKEGIFEIGANTETAGGEYAPSLCALLRTLPNTKAAGRIVLREDKSLKADSYRLHVGESAVEIMAGSPSGFFYAVQTLRVLAETDGKNRAHYTVPCCAVEDAPRFSWRGVLLDEARHFFGKETVKKLIDRMAAFKLNVLHWHLNDDQGWRIEIEKYPRLTEIGSRRSGSQTGGFLSKSFDSVPVAGFYTKADVREILRYAEERFVTVVPEIDLPGHFCAVLAAYPELSCTGEKTEVKTKFGVHRLIACGGKEEVYRFAEDVFREVAELFPSKVIHIGGDEAPKQNWDACPLCAAKREKEGLADNHELQSYLTNRIVEVLKSMEKEAVGWNESLRGENLAPSFIVQYWTPQRDKRAEEYFAKGGRMIFSKVQPLYFDYTYAQTPLRKTYGFERYARGIDMERENFIGIEGALWTEWICDEKKLEFQSFPRIAALAECAWSKNKNGYKEFRTRFNEFRRVIVGWGAECADDAFTEIKNPPLRLFRYAKWGISDPDCEYNKYQKKKNSCGK